MVEVRNDSFAAVVTDSEVPVLVDFWAPWCGPCRAVAPWLEKIQSEKGDVLRIVKINVDDNQELASRLSVQGIPTLILFKQGEEVSRKVGTGGGYEGVLRFVSDNL